jgi:ABC-type antimicrobial peptide transport system permease subunit
MRTILRDLARQPWRTALTIAGIAIGIFALVVFGALAEHFRALVADSKDYVKATIHLATKTNKDGENPGITDDDIELAKSVPGVQSVVPTITLLLDGFNLEDSPLLFLDPKPIVEGLPPRWAQRMRPGVHLVAGRWLRPGDGQKVMIVRWLAKRRHYELGQTIDVRHRPFEVVGFYEAPDIALIPAGFVPFAELKKGLENPSLAHAKQFFQKKDGDDSLAGIAANQLEQIAEKFVSAEEERWYPHEVVPEPGADLGAIASGLKTKLPHLSVIEPEKLAESMEKAVAIFLGIAAVVSVISSIVGGLLIVNTMAMAVVERRREVAIKIAIGASTAQVALEFVAEAAVMGLVGGVLGASAGIGAIAVIDPLIMSRVEVGESLFKVTPALLLAVMSYGIGLGVVAGLVPAIRAARSEPAPGLREL